MSEIKTAPATPETLASIKQVLDVRAPYEWEDTGIIAGSFLISLYDDNGELNAKFVEEIDKSGINLNEPLFIICHSGIRSLSAAKILARIGASDVTSLDGGIELLERSGYALKPL